MLNIILERNMSPVLFEKYEARKITVDFENT